MSREHRDYHSHAYPTARTGFQRERAASIQMARNRVFLTLESISILGTQIGFTMLPLVALYALDASPIQLGVLTAVDYIPFIIFGVFFGAVIDASDPQSISIASNIVRLAAICLLLVAFMVGQANVQVLIIAVFIIALGSAAYDTSVQSLVPLVFERRELTMVNGRFELGRSLGGTLGPAIAGAVLAHGGPAPGLAVLVATYALGLAGVLSIRPTAIGDTAQSWRRHRLAWSLTSTRDGFRYLNGRRDVLAAICLAAVSNLANGALNALAFLHLKNEFAMSPEQTGIVGSIAGAMAIISALGAGRLARIASARVSMLISLLTACASAVVFALADVGAGWRVSVFGVVLGANYCANQIFNVRMISYRQATVSGSFLARVNAAAKALIMAALPVGSLVGGALATATSAGSAILILSGVATIAVLAIAVASKTVGWRDDRAAATDADRLSGPDGRG